VLKVSGTRNLYNYARKIIGLLTGKITIMFKKASNLLALGFAPDSSGSTPLLSAVQALSFRPRS